jgi:hypothetical protein
VARFFNDSDTAAFTSSQCKARDRDDVRLCEGGDYFEATVALAAAVSRGLLAADTR